MRLHHVLVNPMRSHQSQGISLIELMVTIALMIILTLIGLPLTKAWGDSARQREAAGVLAEGLGRAKALAMRNPGGIEDTAKPSGYACLTGSTIAVARTDLGGACGKGQLDWSGTIPTEASAKLPSGSAFQCVAYNSRGEALAIVINGLACTTASPEILLGQEDAFTVDIP